MLGQPAQPPSVGAALVAAMRQQLQQPYFNFDDDDGGGGGEGQDFITVRFMNGRCVNVTREVLEQKDGTNSSKVLARRVQYPLKLAWAMTVHKSQGQTIDLLECDLGRIFEVRAPPPKARTND